MSIGDCFRRWHARGERWTIPVACIAAALLAQPSVMAQDSDDLGFGTINRPMSAARLAHFWDFEDAEETLEAMPRNWFRSMHLPNDPRNPTWRPGFPRFNESTLVDTQSWEGNWSLMLPTRGGSTSVMLARGVAPVQPDADLLITVMIRTDGLEHARARVVARLLDLENNLIESAHATSDPVLSNGGWTRVAFEVTGDPEAVSLQLELQLLQPTQLSNEEPLPGLVVLEDVNGRAYFDDLRVYQVPRIELSTQGTSNLTVAPERPRVSLRVRDLVGEQLHAELRVYDRHGHTVDRYSEAVSSVPRPIEWMPTLPAYGWYRVSVDVRDEQSVIGHAACDFAWLSPPMNADADDARQFGIVIQRDAHELSAMLPGMIAQLGTGSLWLEMWSRGNGDQEDPWNEIGRVIERLLEMRQSVTFILERIPTHGRDAVRYDRDQVLMLMAEDADRWLDRLAPLLTRFGERVRRWQLGHTGSDAPFEHHAPVQVAERVRTALFRMIPRPVVVLPWVADQSVAGLALEAVSILLPRDVPTESIHALAEQWQAIDDLAVIIESPDPKLYGVAEAGVETARRAILAWEAGIPVIGIDSAWQWRSGRVHEAMPEPIFPIWRTLASMLCGRRAAGELPGTSGLRVIIAESTRASTSGATPGLLVAWNESAEPEHATLRGYLGPGRVSIRDLFGNTRIVEQVNGQHEIPLTSEPIFIEGVDTALLRFRAGLRIEPRFIELRAERIDVELVIENPWRSTISGQLRLNHPDGWEISPRAIQFVLQGGESTRIPLRMMLGLHHESGIRMLEAHVSLAGERSYPAGLVMPIEVELGLKGLVVNPAYRFVEREDGGPPDLVLTVLITNIGETNRMLEVLAGAPGYPRKDAMLTDLPPGQAAVRRFVFENASETLRGQRIGIAVREREGTGRWNTRIEIR